MPDLGRSADGHDDLARSRAAHGQGGGSAARAGRSARVRCLVADGCAAVLLTAVIPLCLMQVPEGLLHRQAFAVPPAPGASGLALPLMASVVPIAGVAIRRFRPWPVLVAGLVLLAAGGLLGELAQSGLVIAVDRGLHGTGAGLAYPAVTVVALERTGRARRLLGCWWAMLTVAGLAAAPALVKCHIAAGSWHGALRPFQRPATTELVSAGLVGVALAAAAGYALLVGRRGRASTQHGSALGAADAAGGDGLSSRPKRGHAERTRLALLTVPAAAVSELAVSAGYQPQRVAVFVIAAAASVAVFLVAMMAARVRAAGSFPLLAMTAGITLAPAAGALTDVRSPSGWQILMAVAAGCLVGAAATAPLARWSRAAGLGVAVAGFVIAIIAGPLAGLPVLAAACGLVAAGLTMTLIAGLRAAATVGGVLMGTSALVLGVLVGYLGAAAIQLSLGGPSALSAGRPGEAAGTPGWVDDGPGQPGGTQAPPAGTQRLVAIRPGVLATGGRNTVAVLSRRWDLVAVGIALMTVAVSTRRERDQGATRKSAAHATTTRRPRRQGSHATAPRKARKREHAEADHNRQKAAKREPAPDRTAARRTARVRREAGNHLPPLGGKAQDTGAPRAR